MTGASFRACAVIPSYNHWQAMPAIIERLRALGLVIFVVDDDGYTVGTVLAPNRMEWCYMHLSQATRLVSCTELTKQP